MTGPPQGIDRAPCKYLAAIRLLNSFDDQRAIYQRAIIEDAMAKLLSVNVGLPREIAWQGKVVRTAIWKRPVSGRVFARRLNLDGDGQADTQGHGGEHRAVMVYQLEAYRYWESELGRNDFEYGQFGENFTVEGLADDEVCIGDRYRIGTAVFEVTQPRVTCYRLGIRMENPQMAALLVSHHRPGFYCRVITEGEVAAEDEIHKIAQGPGSISVAEVDSLLYSANHDLKRIKIAAGIPALSSGWKGSFESFLHAGKDGVHNGNPGLTSNSPAPAWEGFRRVKIAKVHRETREVTSLVLADGEGLPLAPARPSRSIPGAALCAQQQLIACGPQLLHFVGFRFGRLPYQCEARNRCGQPASCRRGPGRRHVGDLRAARRICPPGGYAAGRLTERWNRRDPGSFHAAGDCIRN
jgi:MOSC domain-containing protein YiiM